MRTSCMIISGEFKRGFDLKLLREALWFEPMCVVDTHVTEQVCLKLRYQVRRQVKMPIVTPIRMLVYMQLELE